MSDIKLITSGNKYQGVDMLCLDRESITRNLVKTIQDFLTEIRENKDDHPDTKLRIAIIANNYYDMRVWQAECLRHITHDVNLGETSIKQRDRCLDIRTKCGGLSYTYMVDVIPYQECVIYIGDYKNVSSVLSACDLVLFDVRNHTELNELVKNKQYKAVRENYVIYAYEGTVGSYNLLHAKDDAELHINM